MIEELKTGCLAVFAVIILIVCGAFLRFSGNGGAVDTSDNKTVSEKATEKKTEESCNDNTDRITMSKSAADYGYENYQDVLKSLRREGFTNIKCEPVYDVFFGILVSEGDVDKITIDGNSEFKTGDAFLKNAEVVITYHLSYEDDPNYERTNTSAATNTSVVTTEAQKSVNYSTNDKETAKNGNTGVYSYKNKGGQYSVYYIIDFDEGYVYYFTDGNGEETCDRLKIDSGDLNNVVIVTYHVGDDVWSEGLHFKWKNQPDHLILEDNNHFETDFYSTNLNDALNIRDKKKIIDY